MNINIHFNAQILGVSSVIKAKTFLLNFILRKCSFFLELSGRVKWKIFSKKLSAFIDNMFVLQEVLGQVNSNLEQIHNKTKFSTHFYDCLRSYLTKIRKNSSWGILLSHLNYEENLPKNLQF